MICQEDKQAVRAANLFFGGGGEAKLFTTPKMLVEELLPWLSISLVDLLVV